MNSCMPRRFRYVGASDSRCAWHHARMLIRRPAGSISKGWLFLIVLGPAAVAALLVGAPTAGPWIVTIGAIGAVVRAIKQRGGSDGDTAGSTSFGASDSSSDSGSSSC